MPKRAFDMMMEGLDDAMAFAKGDPSRGIAHDALDVNANPKPVEKLIAAQR